MSNQKVLDAKFNGILPSFPEGIEKLHERYIQRALFRWKLDGVAQYVDPSVRIIEKPMTSDGYRWFAGYTFNGTTILFPFGSTDTGPDRYTAVYITDNTATVSALIKSFTNKFSLWRLWR